MFHSNHRILSLVHSHIAVLHIAFFYHAHRNVSSPHPDLFMMIRTVVQNGKGTV